MPLKQNGLDLVPKRSKNCKWNINLHSERNPPTVKQLNFVSFEIAV